VIKVGIGFGSAGGEGTETKGRKGAGMGAGEGIELIGFLVTRGDETSFLSAEKKKKGLAAIFEKVPDLIEKIAKTKSAQKETV
jgi:uncharacterized spore protein YtfJ